MSAAAPQSPLTTAVEPNTGALPARTEQIILPNKEAMVAHYLVSKQSAPTWEHLEAAESVSLLHVEAR